MSTPGLSRSPEQPPDAAAASGSPDLVVVTKDDRPMSRIPRKQLKRFSNKVRTGCITCNLHRLQCDAVKPTCLRCARTGRVCDGYETAPPSSALANSRLPQTDPSRPGILSLPMGSPMFAIPENSEWSDLERRALDFYMNLSVPHIFSNVSGSFWGSVIPALCQQEPAIRHAVFAISSLHENGFYGSNTTEPSANLFATTQYGKALRSLRKWQIPRERSRAAEPLIACALYICVELMYGNFAAARIHINQGRRILAQFNDDSLPAATTEVLRQHLIPVFLKLGVASFLFGSAPEPIPDRFRRMPQIRQPLDSMYFADLAEAEQIMFEMVEDGLVFAKEGRLFSTCNSGASRAELEKQRDQWLVLIQKWRDAFAVLQIASYDPTTQVVQAYCNTLQIFVAMALDRPEMCYDDYTAEFAGVVILCKRILDDEDRKIRKGGNIPKALFNFDSGLVPLLYFVAQKCRHPGLRRSAVALLGRRSTSCRRENTLAPQQSFRSAERAVALEEMRGWKILDRDTRMGSSDGDGEPDVVLLNRHVRVSLDWMPTLFDGNGDPIPDKEDQVLDIEPQLRPILQDDTGETAALPPNRVRDYSELRRLVERPNVRVSPKLAAEAWAALASSSPLLSREPEPFTTVEEQAAAWAAIYDVPACLRIPREARIYDVVVDPPTEGGSWVSFYVEPDPQDSSRLGVFRDFVKHG